MAICLCCSRNFLRSCMHSFCYFAHSLSFCQSRTLRLFVRVSLSFSMSGIPSIERYKWWRILEVHFVLPFDKSSGDYSQEILTGQGPWVFLQPSWLMGTGTAVPSSWARDIYYVWGISSDIWHFSSHGKDELWKRSKRSNLHHNQYYFGEKGNIEAWIAQWTMNCFI